MLDDLKKEIREELQGKKVSNMNDEIAMQLNDMAEKAKTAKDFEKVIACREIILDDVGLDSINAFGAKTTLLAEYCDCGFVHSEEALILVLNLINEIGNSESPGAILPQVHIPAVKVLYCTNDAKYKQMARQFAESAIRVGKSQVQSIGYNDFTRSFVLSATLELVRIYIKEEKYEDAEDLFFSLPDVCRARDSTDPIIISLIQVIEIYGLNEDRGKYSSQALKEIEMLTEIPEARYILGIMAAEGYMIPKNIDSAKAYFEEGNRLAVEYRGICGYTDYEFSVLSDISQEEIIRSAEDGNYHSKFFRQMEKSRSSQVSSQPDSKSTNSSKGCYVATCVYGSYDCAPVWTLRRYRDEILAKSLLGRLFIKCYYTISPTAVKLCGNYIWFHKLFKRPLDKLVLRLQNNGINQTPYKDK